MRRRVTINEATIDAYRCLVYVDMHAGSGESDSTRETAYSTTDDSDSKVFAAVRRCHSLSRWMSGGVLAAGGEVGKERCRKRGMVDLIAYACEQRGVLSKERYLALGKLLGRSDRNTAAARPRLRSPIESHSSSYPFPRWRCLQSPFSSRKSE